MKTLEELKAEFEFAVTGLCNTMVEIHRQLHIKSFPDVMDEPTGFDEVQAIGWR